MTDEEQSYVAQAAALKIYMELRVSNDLLFNITEKLL